MAGNTILLNVQTNVDDATKDLNKIDNGVDKVKKSTKELSEESKKTTMNWTELSSKINVFKEAFGAVKDTVTKIYEVSKQLVQEYEKVNSQMTILKSQKTWGEIKLQFDELEKATGGVIDKFDILESVNKATSFGIDLTQGRLLKLINASSKAAAMMGVDLKFAFDSLIVGTARESKAILDNLGVMVDVMGVQEQYAKSIGKTVEELTDEEQKISVLNAVLDELGRTQANINEDMLKTSGTGLAARASRFWRDVKLGAGEGLSGLATYVDEMFMDLAEKGTKHLSAAMSEQKILINEQASEYVKTLSDIGGVDARLATLLKNEMSIYLEHKALIEDIGSKKIKQAEALQIVNENAFMKNGHERSQERQEYILLETLKEKYGEKTKAEFELQIAKGEAAFELAKKRGEISQDAEFDLFKFLEGQNKQITTAIESTVAWAAKAINVKDAFEQLWDELQDKGTVEVRGSQSVDDATIKNMEATEEKTEATLAKIRNKRLQAKIDKEEKDRQELAKKMQEWRVQELDLDNEIARIAYENKKDWENEKAIAAAEAHLKIEAEKQRHLLELDKIEKKMALESIERAKRKENESAELASKVFDDKWKAMIDFEEKYNTDLKISGEEIDKMSKKELATRLENEEQFYEAKERMQEMGNAVFTAAANSVYNDLISGQEDFLQRAAAVALSTAGSQIFADGLKNVWIGGGQLLATGGLKGGETVAYGVAEMGVGIGLGYMGNQVMPDTATKEGDSASEKNKMDSGNYTFNVTSSLYGTKKEAQRGLNEVMR